MAVEPIRGAAPSAPSSATRQLYPKSDGWYDQAASGGEKRLAFASEVTSGGVTAGYAIPSGRWWSPQVGGALGTQGTGVGNAYFFPILVPSAFALSLLRLEVTTAGAAGALIRAALYKPGADGLPDRTNIIADLGTVDATTTGLKDFAGGGVTVPAGLVWMAVVGQGATSTYRGIQQYGFAAIPGFPLPSTYTPATNTAMTSLILSGVTGTFPTSGTTWDNVAGTLTPRAYLKAA